MFSELTREAGRPKYFPPVRLSPERAQFVILSSA